MPSQDSTVIPSTKPCKSCGRILPNTIEHYRRTQHWLRNTCRICEIAQHQIYYETNREKMRAYDRARYEADPDKYRQYSEEHRKTHAEQVQAYSSQYLPKWLEAHPEKVREYGKKANRKYRQSKPEALRAYQREWRKTHPETARAWAQANPEKVSAKGKRRRAAKRKATINDLTAAQWHIIQEAYRYRCAYCGDKPEKLTQDHVIPLSKGGNHTMNNVVPACISCNSRKHAGPPLKPVQPLLL